MSLKIDSDLNRFKDIVRNKVKHNLGKFISSEKMIGQQGSKTIRIPLHNIDIPHLSFGGRNGGVGTGKGDIGDPFGNEPGSGNQPGDDDGEHDFLTEFTPEELAQILIEHLDLPNLEPKSKGSLSSEKNKYNEISNVGNEGLKHFKRTYREALKRQISIGAYDPKNPVVIPIKSDFRYKTYSRKEKPEINAVIIYMADVSGSIGDEQKYIMESEIFWIDLLLKKYYKDVETRFIIHDASAQEVSREDFFKVSTSGGTIINSAYDFCANMMEKEYPYSEYNVYPFHFSDGDTGQNDSIDAIKTLKERILPNCNMFSYGEVKSMSGSGEFSDFLQANFEGNDKLTISKINNREAILGSIKEFFSKGK